MGSLEGARHSREVAELLVSIPAMPVVGQASWSRVRRLFYRGDGRYWIGCEELTGKKTNSSFVVARRSDLKIVKRFPLTEDGWGQVWQAFVELDANSAREVLVEIGERGPEENIKPELARLSAESLNYLPGINYLGGYAPGVELAVSKTYDLWFLADRLIIVPRNHVDVLVAVPYTEIEAVEIGGPGLIESGGGFSGGSVSGSTNVVDAVIGAVSSKVIANALNSLTTRADIRTIIRIQGFRCEIFLLHTRIVPNELRIELSRSLGAIRQAQNASPEMVKGPEPGRSFAAEIDALSKLASMLDKGLLTRQEFESLKAKMIAES